MYSSTIKPKLDELIERLKKNAASIVAEASTSSEAIESIATMVSSEVSARSKSILSDMLYTLTDKVMETEFFSDISRQNKLYEVNLRQEILNKYKFSPTTAIRYSEIPRVVHALEVGGVVLIAGASIEVGYILISGLSITSIVPIPIAIVLFASVCAAMSDYTVIGPKRSKELLTKAVNDYFVQLEQQLLGWFDEIEEHFNMRMREIEHSI